MATHLFSYFSSWAEIAVRSIVEALQSGRIMVTFRAGVKGVDRWVESLSSHADGIYHESYKEVPMQSIDDLANLIAQLDPSEQQALLDKVAQLNFQKGL